MIDGSRLPRPSDSTALRNFLADWNRAAEELPVLATILADPNSAALLAGIAGNSPHLAFGLLHDPQATARLFELGPDEAVATALEAIRAEPFEGTAQLMRLIRREKRRAQVAIGLADAAGAWDLGRITTALSELAEASLDRAAMHLGRETGLGDGLIVLGMGKLGGRELNYSSDIDLIVLYDAERLDPAKLDRLDREQIQRSYVRLTRELVRIMEERTGDGYGFRCDLRLRPDPGATPLAVSVPAAEIYYTSLGQNWERAAMIKARPVAGNRAAGTAFLDLLQPWIWRRNLDFAAIQDIHSIKRQIDAGRDPLSDHPGETGGFDAIGGLNVKLGRGGIREIEFFAQVQQLVFGGRIPELRTPATLAALDALAKFERIDAGAREQLHQAYRFLRTVEHRLQMVEDRQTHSIPATAEGIDALAAFLGFADTASFRAELSRHRREVETCYGRLFEQAPTLAGPGNLVFTGTEDDPATIATLERMGFRSPQAITAQVRGWHHGRYRAMRSQRARELLTELTPPLLTALGRSAAPDDAFMRFDAFLGALPAGVQLFALFHENRDLLELIAELLGSAPRVAAELARDPSVLDAVLTQDFFGPLPDRAQIARELDPLLERTRLLEEALDRTRRYVAETRFRSAAQILRGITDGPRVGRYLADVADAAIEALLPRVENEFAERHGRFGPQGIALLAMGRLGARRMSVASDLDLVPIYPDLPDDAVSDGEKGLMAQTYFARLTQRAVAALTAPTAAGRLYEVDLRLRPSGDKGPLSVSLESFRRYHLESAWTWEHMALTRARCVYGPPALRAAIDATVRQILLTERDPEKLRADVVDMRARIGKEKPARDAWDVKYSTGGLVDIEFAVQYLILRHAPAHPEILTPETETALARLAQAGLLPNDAAVDLIRCLDLCWRVQGFLRLALDDRFDPATAPPALLAGLGRAVAGPDAEKLGPIDFEDAETILRSALKRASARCQTVFAEA